MVLFPLSYKKGSSFPEFSFFEKRKFCLPDLTSPETLIGLRNPKHNLSDLRSEIAGGFFAT